MGWGNKLVLKVMVTHYVNDMAMKHIFLFICSSILIFSCNSGNTNNKLVDDSMNTWILDNQELKTILSDYIHVKDESKHENSFIEVFYQVINDSMYSYTLMESNDINAFVYTSPHILFQFEEKLICFYIVGLDVFKINEDFIIEFMKKYYPEQYNYYLKFGDYPPPVTGGGLVWELTFQNNYLISKNIYYTQ